LQDDAELLETCRRKLSGLTKYDAQKWLNYCSECVRPVAVKIIKARRMDNEPQQQSSIYFGCGESYIEIVNRWLKIIFIKKAVTERVFALLTWLTAATDNVHLVSFIWLELNICLNIIKTKVILHNFGLHKSKMAQNYEKALSLI
ncbi:hypothetical protein T10_13560, partial [Trichinella papuae]